MLDKINPYRVSVPDGRVNLVVMNATDGLPAAFALLGTRVKHKVAIRLAGGCKGMNAQDKEEMISFLADEFRGYRGLIGSGGTRQTDADGLVDPMITDVPGVIASENPGCVALGTLPRTGMLTLQQDSRLVLDEWGTVPNPDMHGILIVQNGPDGEMGWDGDVKTYLQLWQHYKQYADFSQLGLVAWNGGDVTRDEIMRTTSLGWPTILIEGSGRAPDDVLREIRSGAITLPKNHRVVSVHKGAYGELRSVLQTFGFLE